jgi:hypothetical protein
MKSRFKKVLSELKNTSHKGEQGKIAPNLLQKILKQQRQTKNGQLILQNLMSLVKVVFISY